MPRPDWATARRILATLALGSLGGAAYAALGLPLPWMLGAMTATMAASVAGARLLVPNAWRLGMLTVIGVLLGSGFTADVGAGLLRWLPSLAAIPAYVVISIALGLLLLRRLARLEPVTAFFSAAPGGLSEMMLLGERAGGDMRQIALLHGARIFMIVFCVPFLVRRLGGPGHAAALAPPALADALDLAVLAACAALGFLGGRLLRLPAPMLLGPLVVSAAAHVTGLVATAPPRPVVIAAQVIVGAAMGARFSGIAPRAIGQLLLIGGVLSAVLLGVTLATAGGLHAATGIAFVALTLAYAPGGIAEMSLVALALGIEPLFVATHHVVRIALVVLLAPILFRLWRRAAGNG